MMDFEDLKDDKEIQLKITNLHNSVDNIEKILDFALNSDVYEKLNTEDKVNYNLFMGYTLNTLFWLYLRTKGVDPNKSEVKDQLNRIRQYMVKSKEAHDRNTIRPTIKQDVARRFIKHGIQHSEKPEMQSSPNKRQKHPHASSNKSTNEPPTKRKK
ncbi:hypothetical protein ILUMI_20913 [Ignelater luminosus]|uniref:Nuclear nucleic acid-binding protein C1D n=1 Tax=Ignelater luminosus TaxID=2038154 RepID=A0A8K0CJV1_IGNLU|nr:hypothetical protein ILUMI_20913 [Ignelater luminosus]